MFSISFVVENLRLHRIHYALFYSTFNCQSSCPLICADFHNLHSKTVRLARVFLMYMQPACPSRFTYKLQAFIIVHGSF
jgi:hypothetical protein